MAGYATVLKGRDAGRRCGAVNAAVCNAARAADLAAHTYSSSTTGTTAGDAHAQAQGGWGFRAGVVLRLDSTWCVASWDVVLRQRVTVRAPTERQDNDGDGDNGDGNDSNDNGCKKRRIAGRTQGKRLLVLTT